uniref:DUF659 domain-containing protein n=1 Tax=Rhabditophanes sp. KR3021 TaxID=114890 RepID=A0AC35TR70_9BILA
MIPNYKCAVDAWKAAKLGEPEVLERMGRENLKIMVQTESNDYMILKKYMRLVFRKYFHGMKVAFDRKGRNLPFTFDQFKLAFTKTLPYIVSRNFYALTMWMSSPACQTSNEDSIKRTAELMARLTALLEDVSTSSLIIT